MTLYFIGLGLYDSQDITLRGLKIVKSCDFIYLESYTSILQCDKSKLEELYGKRIIVADRQLVEKNSDDIIENAKVKNIAFLVIGDPMCATTHVDLKMRAKENDVEVKIIHNSSIISAIGEIGLEVYKYGKVTSIPFHNKNIKTPVQVFEQNNSIGLHTLFLLDLDPSNNKFLTIKEAANYLIQNGISSTEIAIGISRIGAPDCKIIADSLGEISKYDFGKAPYSIVIPGKMHFMEEESLEFWKE